MEPNAQEEEVLEADNSALEINAGYNDDPTEMPDKVEAAEPVDKMAEIMARLDKFEAGHSSLAGQVGGLNRTQQELQQTIKASNSAASQVKDAPTKAAVEEAIKDPAEWLELKDDFPEWAVATEKYLDSKMANVTRNKGLDASEIDRVVNEIVEKRVGNVLSEARMASLDAVYEDWVEDVNSPEFSTWIKDQPPEMQKLTDSPKVKDAKKLLSSFYNARNGKPAVKTDNSADARQRRLAAAVTPRGTGGHESGASPQDEIMAGYNS